MQPNEPQQPQSVPVPPVNPPEPVVPTPPQPQPPVEQMPAVEVTPEPRVMDTQADDGTQPEESVSQGPSELPSQEPIQWQAAEYMQHDKTPLWYVVFALVVIALVVAAVFTGAWTFAVLVPVMAVALLVYSHRPPRELTYVVSSKGLYINDQLHPMGEFKAFGVIQEAATNALVMIPVKRFRPSITVNFPSEIGEQLVDTLGAYVPMKEVHPDAFDKIVQKLRI
jgi:hypothetical protein